jgi:hypothetical protein
MAEETADVSGDKVVDAYKTQNSAFAIVDKINTKIFKLFLLYINPDRKNLLRACYVITCSNYRAVFFAGVQGVTAVV